VLVCPRSRVRGRCFCVYAPDTGMVAPATDMPARLAAFCSENEPAVPTMRGRFVRLAPLGEASRLKLSLG